MGERAGGEHREGAADRTVSGVSRRRFLRGAAAATTAVWMAPAVTGAPVSAAFAQASPVPGVDAEVEGVQLEVRPDVRVAGLTLDADGLPRTGNDLSRWLALAAAALASGTAAVRASRKHQHRRTRTADEA